MSVALLDVNVLVALHDPAHPNYEDAHTWFKGHRKRGWATCPLTVNGCIRVLSNPSYPTVEATAGDVAARLRVLCGAPDHHFWEDDLSLLDDSRFRMSLVPGHQMITDIYLLALAVAHHGKLATFDRSIPSKPVVGAEPRHLELLGSS